jgi:hypothetical protein
MAEGSLGVGMIKTIVLSAGASAWGDASFALNLVGEGVFPRAGGGLAGKEHKGKGC